MKIADLIVERDVLANNLAVGTCVGKPASEAQQALRRASIAEIDALLA